VQRAAGSLQHATAAAQFPRTLRKTPTLTPARQAAQKPYPCSRPCSQPKQIVAKKTTGEKENTGQQGQVLRTITTNDDQQQVQKKERATRALTTKKQQIPWDALSRKRRKISRLDIACIASRARSVARHIGQTRTSIFRETNHLSFKWRRPFPYTTPRAHHFYHTNPQCNCFCEKKKPTRL